MEMTNDFNKDDAGNFFILCAHDRLKKCAMRRNNGTYFIKRREAFLRLAQLFCFDKKKSRQTIRFLVASGIAENNSRGIILYDGNKKRL